MPVCFVLRLTTLGMCLVLYVFFSVFSVASVCVCDCDVFVPCCLLIMMIIIMIMVMILVHVSIRHLYRKRIGSVKDAGLGSPYQLTFLYYPRYKIKICAIYILFHLLFFIIYFLLLIFLIINFILYLILGCYNSRIVNEITICLISLLLLSSYFFTITSIITTTRCAQVIGRVNTSAYKQQVTFDRW